MGTEVDINVIAENLTELLQNSVNMASVFYDIFLNPEPMDVTLTQINADGEAVTISIPNRAKDMQLATVGVGSPEGLVEAGEGKIYVDSETLTCYIKVTGTGTTGWNIILTEQGVYTYIDNYLTTCGFFDEERLQSYLEEHTYTTEEDVASIIASSTVVQYVTTLNTSGNIILDDNTFYKITPTGDVSFTLPQIMDFTQTHKISVQVKLDSEIYEIDLGCTNYFDQVQPTFGRIGMYDIRYEFDTASEMWVCGVTPKGAAANYSLSQLTYFSDNFQGQVNGVRYDLDQIEELIPGAASSENQLADKNFVNSSIATNTSNFIGTFNSLAELEAYSGTVTNNDYAFVMGTDSSGNTEYNRYKYNGETEEWVFEYTLNNSSFTAVQWAAINSGITSVQVAEIEVLPTLIDEVTTIKDTMSNYGDIVEYNVSDVTSAIAGKTVATFTNITAGTGADVSKLTINKLTKAEYDTITPDSTELYFVTDEQPIEMDTVLSSTSENPVQNKVINSAIGDLQAQINTIMSGGTVNARYDSNTETIIFEMI